LISEADPILLVFTLLLVVLLAVMLHGVSLARRGRVSAHARVMVACFVVFLLALVAFEVRVRMGEMPPLARRPLIVHLCVAVPGLLLWIWQVATAKRAEPAVHRLRGRILLALLSATVATGFWLYVATFF
jgi:uncharacterized membrane protein